MRPWEVMKAYEEGKQIQILDDSGLWKDMVATPKWNWATTSYRVKPEYSRRPLKHTEYNGEPVREANANNLYDTVLYPSSKNMYGVIFGSDKDPTSYETLFNLGYEYLKEGKWQPMAISEDPNENK